MKSYGVLCIPDMSSGQINIVNVIVDATDCEHAKQEAIKTLKMKGYINPIIAPELPGTVVVRERGGEDKNESLSKLIKLIKNSFLTFEEKVVKARSLVEQFVNEAIGRGVPQELAVRVSIMMIRHFMAVNEKIKFSQLSLVHEIFYLGKVSKEKYEQMAADFKDENAEFLEEYLSTCVTNEKIILQQLLILLYTIDEEMTDEERKYLENFA